MLGRIWKYTRGAWKWVAGAVSGLLLLFIWLSNWVGRSTFAEDLASLVQKLKLMADFFARQPEWVFYPLLLALLVVTFASFYSQTLAHIVVAREARRQAKEEGWSARIVEPRRLRPAQIANLSRARSPSPRAPFVVRYVEAEDCYDYARDFNRALSSAVGWHLAGMEVVDAAPAPGGLAVLVRDKNNFTTPERLLTEAFEAVRLKFEVREGRGAEDPDGVVLVTTRPL